MIQSLTWGRRHELGSLLPVGLTLGTLLGARSRPKRSRCVLASCCPCAEGLSNGAAAKKLHLTGATVCKWRERFRVSRLEGLLDEPRPGAPRSITDAQVEEVVTQTLESMPVNSTHWSTRLMAEKTGLSQTAIVRIWRAFGLQPHRVENFKFSKDPQFVEKVRDIVGLYLNPPDRAIVLCRRKESGPGAEPYAADSAAGPRRTGATIP